MRLHQCVLQKRPHRRRFSVIAIGAERPDEFAEAIARSRQGQSVTVINPRVTAAAQRFMKCGGDFVRGSIDDLPQAAGPFDLIIENYPFTVGFVQGVCEEEPCPFWLSQRAVYSFAIERLKRLAPGGCWILWTESPGLAGALRRLLQTDPYLAEHFDLRIVSRSRRRAPASLYPRLPTRFRIQIDRLRSLAL